MTFGIMPRKQRCEAFDPPAAEKSGGCDFFKIFKPASRDKASLDIFWLRASKTTANKPPVQTVQCV